MQLLRDKETALLDSAILYVMVAEMLIVTNMRPANFYTRKLTSLRRFQGILLKDVCTV